MGYHLIHSYAPGEVTPEQAHAVGVEFAARLLGDQYEAVVSTHLDRNHLHCHILFNSVSFVNGEKYRNAFHDYFGDIRGISNEVSKAHGPHRKCHTHSAGQRGGPAHRQPGGPEQDPS